MHKKAVISRRLSYCIAVSISLTAFSLLESCSTDKTFTQEQIDSYTQYNFGGIHAYFSNGKWGFTHEYEDTLTQPIYDDIELSYREIEKKYRLIKVQHEGKWGMIISNGRFMLPGVYENIVISFPGYNFPCYNPFIFAKQNNKWALCDTLGKSLTEFKYDTIYNYYYKNNEGIAIRLSGKMGIISCKDFSEIIPPIYDTIFGGGTDQIIKVKIGNAVGLIKNLSNKTVVPVKFEDIELSNYNPYTEGVKVKLNGKWGVVDTSGKEIFPIKYDNIFVYALGDSLRAQVMLNNKYGWVDGTGKEILPIIYDEIYHREIWCCVAVRIGNKIGVVHRLGKVLIPVKYEDLARSGEGEEGGKIMALPPPTKAKLNGKWGYLDSSGKEITPFKYDKINTPCYCLTRIPVKYKGYWGFIDRSGKEVGEFIYSNIQSTEQLFFIGEKTNKEGNGRLGIIDPIQGKAITPFVYENIIPLDFFDSTGVIAAVKLNNRWGFIDNKGNQLVKPKYDFEEIKPYDCGLAAVQKDGKWGFISKTGNIVVPIKYDEISGYFSKGRTGVSINGKWGLLDSTGKIISPIKRDSDWLIDEQEDY
jgi:hypothetical protein